MVALTVASAAHDFLSVFDPSGGIAGVDHQLGLLNDVAIVVVGVVGYDDDAVVLSQVFQIRRLHLQIVLPALANEWDVGIVICDLGSIFLQEFDDGERRLLAQIVDVFLVSHAQDQHPRAIHGLLLAIERAGHRR